MRYSIVVLILITLFGCGKKETETEIKTATVQLRDKANSIVKLYSSELKGELMKSLKEGPANAIAEFLDVRHTSLGEVGIAKGWVAV